MNLPDQAERDGSREKQEERRGNELDTCDHRRRRIHDFERKSFCEGHTIPFLR